MSRNTATAAVPAYLDGAILALAAASVAPQGVSLGCSPALVGYKFGLYGSLDPAASATGANSANLRQLGTWTPTATPGGIPQAPPGQPSVDGWPSILAIRLTPGTVTGNLIATAEATSLATTTASATFATAGYGVPAMRVGDFLATPITTPGAQTRIQLDAAQTLTGAVDLWVGDADLSGYKDTSSAVSITTTGPKTLTVAAGKSFRPGDKIRLTFSSTVYCDATVVTYATTSLVVNVTTFHGTGGNHAWAINFTSAPPGYFYLTRLHGGGQSLLIGEGATLPTGLYIQCTPVSGTPVKLFAQGTSVGAAAGPTVAASVSIVPGDVPIWDSAARAGYLAATSFDGGPAAPTHLGLSTQPTTISATGLAATAAGDVTIAAVAGDASLAGDTKVTLDCQGQQKVVLTPNELRLTTATASAVLSAGVETVDADAIFTIKSTDRGVRLPVMTTAQKKAIAGAAAGLLVYDSILGKLSIKTAAGWETIQSLLP